MKPAKDLYKLNILSLANQLSLTGSPSCKDSRDCRDESDKTHFSPGRL